MSINANCPPRSKTGIVLNVAMAMIATGCIGISTFASTQVVNNRERLAAIEASRFSSEDGLDVWKKIAELQGQPPAAWLIDRIDRIEAKLDQLLDKQR